MAAAVAAAAVALLLPLVPSAAGGSRQPLVRHVIVLSLDGARADALADVWPQDLAAASAASWTARTTLPSSTLPAHVSMVTGVGPAVHGVRFNDWSPGRPRLARPTIFTEVRRHGGAAEAVVAKSKLRFLVPDDLRADYLSYPRHRMAAVLVAAADRFRARRPALLFVHVADPDAVGHDQGWMSAPYRRVIAEVPGAVRRLLAEVRAAGLLDATLIVVTADHGGHDRTHGTSRPEDVTIPWVALGGPAAGGTVLSAPVVIYDTAATVLHVLGVPIPPRWEGRPIVEALRAKTPAGR